MMWNELKIGKGTFFPIVRKLSDMKEILFDKSLVASAEMDMELYYIFRDVSRDEKDAQKIKEIGLRYDITIIPPRALSIEFVKTAGHYHPYISGSALTYPEIYEVLEGEAHFLLQKRKDKKEEEEKGNGIEEITDVVVVKAKKGDVIIVPPNYGHVTINHTEKTVLKMANLVARPCSAIYEPVERKGGAAYFELTTGEFVKNERYEAVPPIRFLEPADTWIMDLELELEPELSKGVAIYELLKVSEKLKFLTDPMRSMRRHENPGTVS